MGAIVGFAVTTIRRWQGDHSTFPVANKKGELCIRDVVQWYLVNKAPVEVREDMCRRLAEGLDWQIAGQEASKTDKPEQPVSKADIDASYREQVNRLKLRTEDAAFHSKFGDAIRVKHVKFVLAGFARKVREWAEEIQKRTGHPVTDTITAAVAQAISDLQEYVNGGGDGNASD